MIAKTFQGLEEILAEELTTLGANDVQIGRRMVSFTGDKEMMYKANFCLRTAIRILKPIKHFTAKDADAVYEQIKAIRWEEILDVDKTFPPLQVCLIQSKRCHCRLFPRIEWKTPFCAYQQTGCTTEYTHCTDYLYAFTRFIGRIAPPQRLPSGSRRSSIK